MQDISADKSGIVLERIIAANDAHLSQLRWYETLQNAAWDTWPECVQLDFFYSVPTTPLDDIARFVN